MKASDLFVRCLEAEGIARIYGVPGEENADFMLSLEGSPIEFVLTRHEQGAAFMAEVHGRLTGQPGVCLGTLGPGATNLMTGVADGNMDRAPMLVLTGQGATTRQHKESHQVMNVRGMFEPVTKWSQQVLDPGTIPEIVRKAVKLATAEKPGAAHVELAENVAAMETDAEPLRPRAGRRPAPDAREIEAIAEALLSARRPLIIAGNGCIRKRASAELRRLCEATGIGVLMTFMAKGAVDRDAEHCLYTIGMGQRDIAMLAIEDADLILTVGYDMVEYPPQSWNPDRDKIVAHLDFLPAEVDAHYQPEIEAVGDIAAGLARIAEIVEARGVPDYDLGNQARVRARMWDEIARHADDAGPGPIRPQKAIWDAMQVLDDDAIVLSGVGAHKMWVARHFQAKEPGTVLISNGFCSMGMPLPGAIAAALACPGRQVLGIAGDGDALMNVQEMETAARLGSDIVLMVWEDHGYGLIEWKQEQEFGRHTDLSFGNPDWVGLAESFGWKASRCEAAEDLAGALRTALGESGPSLLVVPIDYSENMKLTRRLGEITCRL